MPRRADLRTERPDMGDRLPYGGMVGQTIELSPLLFCWTLPPLEPLPNRLPRGNMWSAIPFALLCMIVNWSERKQGSGPKGEKVL